ncbi:WSC domain-containing protein [Tricladium varicosporioides]|nr:WSC domain-containing protein [Hymenoscyphus varicosporioides]
MYSIVFAILVSANLTAAFFRLPCASPILVERADPVVNPGQVSGHVHTIMGGNGFGFQMDYASTQKSTCSSCSVVQDMSNYWTPSVYYRAKNKTFTAVQQTGGALIYYLQRKDPNDPSSINLSAFPEGFRMIAGNPTLRSYRDVVEQNAINWACIGTDDATTPHFPKKNCPSGLRMQVFFPSCWNGKDVDSPDHKSHVAYPSGLDHGICPPGFPKRFISIFYEVLWATPEFSDMWYGDDQPFVLSNGDPTGYGLHGDFVNGWNVTTLQLAIDKCNIESGVIEECPYFDFISNEVAQSCRVPNSINEQIFGTMDKLPGCNPVQAGPENAKPPPASSCDAPHTIEKPRFSFTDMTESKHFAYTGCGLDPGGQPRTLQGASMENDMMTVESCIDFCIGKGFNIAGVEYSTQCFCDNSLFEAKARAPVSGLLRNCAMPCSGNNKEVCGGGGLISLYQKCAPNDCKNVNLVYINGTGGSNSGQTAAGTAAGNPIKLPQNGH